MKSIFVFILSSEIISNYWLEKANAKSDHNYYGPGQWDDANFWEL